jgi:hypothetical protein
MNVCSYIHCLGTVIIHCSGIFGFIGLYHNQATDFDDVSSFFWYVTENVRLCIDSVHDTSDIEIYILQAIFWSFSVIFELWVFCVLRHFFSFLNVFVN